MDQDVLPSCAEDALCFPPAEQAANRKQRCTGQLRQFLPRERDFHLPLFAPTHLFYQAHQQAGKPRRHFFCRDFAKANIQLIELPLDAVRNITPEKRVALQCGPERTCLPDQSGSRLYCTRADRSAGEVSLDHAAQQLSRTIQPQDNILLIGPALRDLQAAGEQQHNSIKRLVFQENIETLVVMPILGTRDNGQAISHWDVKECFEALDRLRAPPHPASQIDIDWTLVRRSRFPSLPQYCPWRYGKRYSERTSLRHVLYSPRMVTKVFLGWFSKQETTLEGNCASPVLQR